MALSSALLRDTFKSSPLDETIVSLRRSTIFTRKSSIKAIKVFQKKKVVGDRIFQKERRLNQLFRFRNERRSREDVLEAGKSTGGAIAARALDKGKGFLGRIMNALGYLLLGWLTTQLPKILAFVDTLRYRIGNIIDAGKRMIQDVRNIFVGIKGVVSQAITNIKNFDFTDSEGKLQKEMDQLNQSFEDLGADFDDAVDNVKNITKPEPEPEPKPEPVPIPVTPTPTEPTPTTPSAPKPTTPAIPTPVPTPSVSGANYSSRLQPIHRKALDKISQYESAAAGNYNAMNQGTVNDSAGRRPGSGSSKRIIGRDLTKMSIADILKSQDKRLGNDQGFIHAAGRYQFLRGTLQMVLKQAGISDKVKFSPDVQDYLAAVLLTMPGGGLSHWTADRRTGLLRDRAGMDLINKAARTPLKKASPVVQSPPSVVVPAPPTPQQPPTPPAPRPPKRNQMPGSRPTISTGGMNLIPLRSGERGLVQGGSGSRRGPDGTTESQYATHYHIDGPANLSKKQRGQIREVAFHAIKAMFNRGSHVHLGSSAQTLYRGMSDSKLRNAILYEQQRHDARSSPAVDIQELNSKLQRTLPGQPGARTTFPFAVGQVYTAGGYGREAKIIGTDQISVSHGAEGSSASNVKPVNVSSNIPRGQRKRGGTLITYIPVPVGKPKTVPVGGSPMRSGSSGGLSLNSIITDISTAYT
jgi:hypothetical protein